MYMFLVEDHAIYTCDALFVSDDSYLRSIS